MMDEDNGNGWMKKAGVVIGLVIGVITVSTFMVSFVGKMYRRDFVQEAHQRQIEQISRQLDELQKTLVDQKVSNADFQSRVNEQIGGIEKRVEKLPAINWWLQENVRAVNRLGKKVDSMAVDGKRPGTTN